MSGDPTDEELQELREEKMEQLKERQGDGEAEAAEAQRQQADAQRKAMLRKALTDGARKRLNTVQMSKPQFGEKVEQQDRKSTRLNSSHRSLSRMPSSA